MTNSGGTILSSAQRQASLRQQRMRALLLSSALGTALLGLTCGTNPALAACSPNGFGNQTANASQCGGGAMNASASLGNLQIDLNANLTNVSGNGITGNAGAVYVFGIPVAGGNITLTPTGTRTVTGSTNGIVLTPDLNADVNLSNVTVNGLAGDGLYVHNTIGIITVTGNAATNIHGSQDGMDLATTAGIINVNGFTGSTTGGVNGINASALGGIINLNNFAGHADGQTGVGIAATVGAGAINMDNFAATGHAEGGTDGIALSAGLGTINMGNFAGHAEGDSGAGIRATTVGGTINADGFTGRAEGGTDGLNLQSTAAGNINLNNFSGQAIGTFGSGISAQTLGGNVGMDNFTGGANGGTNGIFAAAGGNLDFSQTSITSNIHGGVNGLNFQQGFGTVDVDLAGQVTGGTTGVRISSMPVVGQTSIHDIDLDTAAGSLVVGTTGNGIDINKQSLGGNVNVTTNGTVMGGATGISVQSLIGGDTTTTITNNGKTSGGTGGISSITASLGGAGTTNVYLNNQQLDGGTGIGVLALTGGSVVAGTGAASTTVDVNAGSGIKAGSGILAGSYSGGGKATTTVHVDEQITATNGFGVIAFAAGADGAGSTATVENSAKVIAAGSGLITAAVNGNASTTVGKEVDFGGFVGAGAFAYNGDAEVTVKDKVHTDTGTFGALAVSYGGNATVTSDANGVIDPPAIGMGAVAIGPGTATVTNGALVEANNVGLLGVSISQPVFGPPGAGLIDINANAEIKSDGIGILAIKGGDGNTDIDVDAAIGGYTNTNTGGAGIQVFNFAGSGLVTVDTTTNGTIHADGDGISITKLFSDGDPVSGNAVLVTTNAAIDAGKEGIEINQVGSGNIGVTNNAAIQAGGTGIFVLKAGSGDVNVNANANITSATGNGIEANALFGTGSVVIDQAASTTIKAEDFGIIATKSFGTGDVKVTTHADSTIDATAGGIFAAKFGGDGTVANGDAVVVSTGDNSHILTNGVGIYAGQFFGAGNVAVTTGTGSNIGTQATPVWDGIVAEKVGGTGDVNVTAGSRSTIFAYDDGITATNFAFGPGNDVTVKLLAGTTGNATSVVAGDNAIVAGGWDNVSVVSEDNNRIFGDANNNGSGSAIRIFAADTATVTIGSNNVVSGSGQSWSNAVIKVRSDDATNISVGTGSVVTSNAYAVIGDQASLITSAAQIVIDTDGGKTTIDNSGLIVGRVGLTNRDDVFNIDANGTWISAGVLANNYFGRGYDQVNNAGLVLTALQGTVAETTNFFGLETFANTGTLSMSDELPGDLVFNATRDTTYVSGVFSGSGASTLAVDSFLGKAGSTSDVLEIGGKDQYGNLISSLVTPGQTQILVNDVNSGAGAFNLQGILVVNVLDPNGVTYGKNTPGQTASFVISPDSANYSAKFGGVIDKGLFFYDLAVIGNDQYLIGLPDQEVFELPKLVTGAQAVWHETTGVWLDRQADLRTYLQGTSTTLVTKTGVQTVNGAPGNVTPGVWGKVVGSWGSRDASDSFTAYGRTYNFDTSYSQDVYGFIAGADFGKEAVFSTNDAMLFGVMGGYVSSNLEFDNSPSSADYTGGTVGVYATYLTDAFYFDALLKGDFLSMDYSASSLVSAGYLGRSSDVTNLGFVLDTGYRLMKWGTTGFVDGLATLSYVNTKIDNLALVQDTVADFGNNDSLRGSIGARVGAQAYDADTYRLEASLSARLWYEFLGDNSVTLFNPGTPFTTVDNFDGAFGEVTLGLNAFGKGNGWNGFVNGSVKFGESYTAGSAKGGVRYQW